MHVFRDEAAIRAAVTALHDAELTGLIDRRIAELSEYEDSDLGELVNLFVIEPGDALEKINGELGFALMNRPIDIIEAHPHWYEMTIVLSDDGFGVVLYVPVSPDVDPDLLALCQSRAAGQERSQP